MSLMEAVNERQQVKLYTAMRKACRVNVLQFRNDLKRLMPLIGGLANNGHLDALRLAMSLIVLCRFYCLGDIISNLLQQFDQIT